MFESASLSGCVKSKSPCNRFKPALVVLSMLLAPLSSADEWRFEVAPYYWAAKHKGDIAQLPSTTTEIDGDELVVDFASKLDSGTEGVGLIALSASKGNWLLWTEAYSVESDNSEPGTFWNTDVTAKQTFLDIDLGYRFLHDDELDLYVYGGLRVAEVDGNMDLTEVESREIHHVDIGDDWVDPIIGIQSRWQLSETWAYWTRLEAAGFGVGSETSWQLIIEVDQKLSENISMRYAYRFVGVDYDDNDFNYDVSVSGLMIGVGFGF